jgi:hypothetical protein
MSYYPNDQEPELPPDTCPYINFVQEVLDQIKDTNKSKVISSQISLINDTLEYIRDANASLRDCSKYWKKKFDNKGKKK